MVYLARTAYAAPRRNPAELCDRDAFCTKELLDRHLFDVYLPAVYDAQHPSATPAGRSGSSPPT